MIANPEFAKRRSAAFTLLELSIVLVVIGLLVGSVLVGKDLIEAGKRRGVLKEFEALQVGIQTYRLKYNCVAGDCPNATQFWGQSTLCNSTVADATITPAVPTCNGDGNGVIGNNTREVYSSWQQLANAGLIDGQYTGVPHVPGYGLVSTVFGVNAPVSKNVNGGGWEMLSPTLKATSYFNDYQKTFRLATKNVGQTGLANLGILVPSFQKAIDDKIDDGAPGTGKLVTYLSTARANCNTTNNPLTSVYDLSQTTGTCVAIFVDPY